MQKLFGLKSLYSKKNADNLKLPKDFELLLQTEVKEVA